MTQITIGNANFLVISAKSAFLSVTCDCPAAKCAQTKHIDVALYTNLIATAPLFPVAPPKPVFTESTATSLINAACSGFTNTYKHTPTSCWLVRMQYWCSRERTFCSSSAHALALSVLAATMFEALRSTISWNPIAKMSIGESFWRKFPTRAEVFETKFCRKCHKFYLKFKNFTEKTHISLEQVRMSPKANLTTRRLYTRHFGNAFLR